jgi:hypothetical protein
MFNAAQDDFWPSPWVNRGASGKLIVPCAAMIRRQTRLRLQFSRRRKFPNKDKKVLVVLPA